MLHADVKQIQYRLHANAAAITDAEATHLSALREVEKLGRHVDIMQMSVEDYITVLEKECRALRVAAERDRDLRMQAEAECEILRHNLASADRTLGDARAIAAAHAARVRLEEGGEWRFLHGDAAAVRDRRGREIIVGASDPATPQHRATTLSPSGGGFSRIPPLDVHAGAVESLKAQQARLESRYAALKLRAEEVAILHDASLPGGGARGGGSPWGDEGAVWSARPAAGLGPSSPSHASEEVARVQMASTLIDVFRESIQVEAAVFEAQDTVAKGYESVSKGHLRTLRGLRDLKATCKRLAFTTHSPPNGREGRAREDRRGGDRFDGADHHARRRPR